MELLGESYSECEIKKTQVKGMSEHIAMYGRRTGNNITNGVS